MQHFKTKRPLRGKIIGGGFVDLKIGCEVFQRKDGDYQTTQHAKAKVSGTDSTSTKIVFSLHPHIASTDLERA